MNAELITIGDELLIGQIPNSNSAFIGKELTKIGIEVKQIKTISDERQDILNALRSAGARTDIVLITGGLGPTNDDITKKTLVGYFKDELVINETVRRRIEDLFSKMDEPLLQVNLDQAKMPSKAEVLQNRLGTASGMWFDENGVVYIALPGVPYEMKALLGHTVIPKLRDKFKLPFILQKTILTYGVGESRIANKIKDWENALPEFVSLAYLPSPGMVRLRLTARGENKQKLQKEIDDQIKKLNLRIGDITNGYEGETSLEEEIAKTLTDKELTLATAESCTGGKIAVKFMEIPGASAYFKAGFVPYFTSEKIEVLGVERETIDRYSVVSAQVAEEMARQAGRKFRSDFALATTGNAGPSKGESPAEVGTVFIALAAKDEVITREFHFGRPREKVVQKAVFQALSMLKEKLDQYA